MQEDSRNDRLRPCFTPADLVELVNQVFDISFAGGVEVQGEVSSFKVNQSKYVFFDLKDKEATVGCFMSLFHLKVPLEDGMLVRVVARPNLTAWGKFSLVVSEVRPVGEGSIVKARDLARQQLAKEGLFDESRKRPLPTLVQQIGVVSSRQAAGFADFWRILNDQVGGIKVHFRQVLVQGDAAAGQISQAIAELNQQKLDLIVIVRGGGSADDLAAFDDIDLVRTVAASRTPILVGVGHEIDQNLINLAADVAAATPTHAAQLIANQNIQFYQNLRHQVGGVQTKTLQTLNTIVEQHRQKLDQIVQTFEVRLAGYQQNIQKYRQLLELVDPERVLGRGYAIVAGKQEVGQELIITTKDKIIYSEVKNVQKRKK